MKVRIKKLAENARMPEYAHADDFCADLFCSSIEDLGNNVYKYNTGLAFEIEREKEDGFKYGLGVRCRSSVYKQGMVLTNGVGTIDEGYRGEVSMVFRHIDPTLPKYEVGNKMGQIFIERTIPMGFVWADELTDTERGNGGYGSSGK